jgi:hypothetical protein
MSFADWKKKKQQAQKNNVAESPSTSDIVPGNSKMHQKVLKVGGQSQQPFGATYSGPKYTGNSFREYTPPSSQVTSAAANSNAKVLQPRQYKPVQDYEPLPDPDMPVGAEAVENTSQQQSGGLFDGNYDEAASAQLFQDALKDWRSGGSSAGSNSTRTMQPARKPAPRKSEGGSQTGVQARGGIKVLMARPPGQRMRCSTPEHEKEGVNTLYATLPAPEAGPRLPGAAPRPMQILQQAPQQQQYGAYKPPTGAASLGGGMLDETANKKEFQAAMADWRSRKGPIKIVYE